ncbi:protein of unknown function [Parapedobacter composti]|uniref:Uncharacterized protein n=1 Tax=Parapedobacter composti TaxID=623281 RepID=A0A1I1LAV1_9SPHI|nr:FecR domain-containing protein [Parapedobacter composti]SFC68128.1 protein of unknown function [Parapedobacter composti]
MQENEGDIPGRDRDSRQSESGSGRHDPELSAQIGRMITKHADDKKMRESDRERLWISITQTVATKVKTKASRNRRWIVATASAAVVAVTMGIGLWFNRTPPLDEGEFLKRLARERHADLSRIDSVRLASSTGTEIAVGDDAVLYYQDSLLQITGGDGTKRELVLHNPDVYNTLIVPYGKRTEVVLADGTKVWLNAGSELTFPVVFGKGSRAIYLEGEGYFDVAHREGQPFVVHLADMEINVLGTTFNVSAYTDDSFSSAVLLTGAIELKSKQKNGFNTVRLKPGKKATLNRKDRQLTVADASGEDDISWTKKQLILKSMPVSGLIRRLERVYNTAVVLGDGAEAADEKISGSLDLTQPLADVLSIIYEPDIYRINQEERRFVISRKN